MSKRRAPRSRRSSAPPSPARGRTGTIATVVVALLFAGAAIVVFWVYPRSRHAGVGRNVDVAIADGESDEAIVAKLEAAGVVDHPRIFALWTRIGGGLQAKSGRHVLSDDLSPLEVLRRLRRSDAAAKVKVVVPEGFNRFDLARRLHDKRACDGDSFLAATTNRDLLSEFGLSSPSAEGFLFPATYQIPADDDPLAVARMLLQQGKTRIDKAMHDHPDGVDDLQRTLGWGVHEIVTLASIVEKEAAVDEERPMIASVFLNRLRDPSFTPHRLQADPTAAYGCLVQPKPTSACVAWIAAGAGKPTAEIEHDADNAWSTYTHEGLPPTPIASPGEKSLVAVLAPARTKYLYFVAKGGGRHTFSESLDQHNQAVKVQP